MSADLHAVAKPLRYVERQLRAMGCANRVVVVGEHPEDCDRLAHWSASRILELERRWSRFSPESDVSRLNRASGSWVDVDSSTLDLLDMMVSGWRMTAGAFDPTLLAPLVALGAGPSWHDPASVTSLPAGARWRGDPGGIEIDRGATAARLPEGTVVDAGGVGKGLAADMVVAALLDEGAAGALVNVGGDLRVGGTSPDALGWTLSVSDGLADLCTVHLQSGGVATSGIVHRRWTAPDGCEAHHLLDPQDGGCLATGPRSLRAATVIAGEAGWAEVLTKAVFVRGREHSLPWLDSIGVAALAVDGDGTVHANQAWQAFDGKEIG